MDASSSKLPPRRRKFQFSLRAALVVLTLVAIAGWWWQRRFQVESTSTTSKLTSQGVERVETYRTQSMRRQGLDVVRDGPTTVVDDQGKVISEEEWRNGVRHGVYRRWDEAGEMLFECEFRRGRLLRVGEATVADFFPSGAATSGPIGQRVVRALKSETMFHYLNQPLSAVKDDIVFNHNIPILLDGRAMAAAGIDADVPITANIRDMPLFVALVDLLAPLKLACAYRYDVLWITTPDSILHDDDLAPGVVSENASTDLLKALSNAARFDYLDQPLESVLEHQALTHDIKIETEAIGAAKPVTLSLQFDSLRSALGILTFFYELRCDAEGDTLVFRDAGAKPPVPQASSRVSPTDERLRID